jgi:hypothetical protein
VFGRLEVERKGVAGVTLLAAALIAALTPQVADDVREALVRHIVGAGKAPYFKAYCLAVTPKQLRLPPTPQGQVGQVLADPWQDAPPLFLSRFRDLPHRILAESSCVTITDQGDEEVVERGQTGPALRILVGPLDAVSSDRVRAVVFTRSGSLTDTFTRYELAVVGKRWVVVAEKILLQA